jgi:putative ABC transport system permease protein
MAYTVSLKTHEIGIRMALGAQRKDVLSMVLKKGLALIITGTMTGLVLSLAMTRLMASQIWGISTTDPWTFSAVAAVILAVGLAACLFPARRASQVDPMVSLRYE